MENIKQETTTIGILCLVMSYVACKITCNPMFYRSIEVHLPYVNYPAKIATSVFLYPLTFVICDLISTLLPRRQTLFIILFGAGCDGFFSYITKFLSYFAIPHAMKPTELQLVQAIDLLGPYMWLLFYRGVIASIVTTIAEVTFFTILFKRIKNINLSIICSVTTVLLVHNLVLNYPLRRREAGGAAMVIHGLIFEIIFLVLYILLISTFKKFWGNKSFQGSTSYFANNFVNFVDKLSFKDRHAKIMNAKFKDAAHDIQSPIFILDSVVHNLEDTEIFKDHIEDLKDSVSKIQALAGEMLENVRNDMADVTNDAIYENKLEYVKANKLIKTTISGKNIEYDKKFIINFKDHSPDRPHVLSINPTKFKLILSNLLNNARDALINSSDIKEILIEIFEDKNIQIIVTNHGDTIQLEQIDRVLNGFSTKHAGDGIGLSSAVKYLKTINSKLTITSSEKDGTKVTMTFPIQKR